METQSLHKELENRILVLDGGMGTMLQRYGMKKGECPEAVVLERPEVIKAIHREYLEAGADIVTTDTFNATSVSLKEYGLAGRVREIARRAAELAREAVKEFEEENGSRCHFVAGSIGPTSRSTSIATDAGDLSHRDITFEELEEAYAEEIRGLTEGGADLLIIETCFDALNAKAAISAAAKVADETGKRLPIIVSATLTDSGRLLGGQTLEAFAASVAHAEPLAYSLNCSFGADALLPYVERLSKACLDTYICAYPNAGMPNVEGGYDQSPEEFGEQMEKYLERGCVNIIGGCCGTTPDHIRELAARVKGWGKGRRHIAAGGKKEMVLSGLEPLKVTPELNFINIGERTNVAGSAKFARLVREENWDEALGIARAQVEAGAQIVDVCMDAPMIDAPQAMCRFLKLMGADPDISRVPVMIDSSDWAVIEAALKVVPGKSIVNSISLKEGESTFLERARKIRRCGAATVVMLFDEKGQADTYERKIEVAGRAYRLLTENGFPAEDIILDPNILAVGTGIKEHDRYALDFIRATEWIKKNLPGAKVSGGVSNLSFAFRGNNPLREAMHTAFLYHAARAGMDMAIVNPQMLGMYDEIPPELLGKVEDLLLCRKEGAADALADFARGVQGQEAEVVPDGNIAGGKTARERLRDAMIKGKTETLAADLEECMAEEGSAVAVIEKVLMPAMEEVGKAFGEGKMFLPQVVRTAGVMKQAVAVLSPFIGSGSENPGGAGTVVVATVKGDVHDIGKNIAAVVMNCSGYKIEDMGVMAEAEDIARRAEETGAVAITLSGLITPSLEEMVNVCKVLERNGMKVPVLIAGATTSELHTALKIAPVYSGPVIHTSNANENCRILASLTGPSREEFIAGVRSAQEELRRKYAASGRGAAGVEYAEALERRHIKTAPSAPKCGMKPQVVHFAIEELEPIIDWNFFYHSWGLTPDSKYKHISGCDCPVCSGLSESKEAVKRRLRTDASVMLTRFAAEGTLDVQGVIGVFPAVSDGENILLKTPAGDICVLPMLRSQRGECKSLCDYVFEPQEGDLRTDFVGCFTVSAGVGLVEFAAGSGDRYASMMAKFLADRLAEAAAVRIQEQFFGTGLRAAFGYSSCPDHSLKRRVFDLLEVEKYTTLRLNDHFMIEPAESVCGVILPEGTFFEVGKIDDAQLASYASRTGLSEEILKKLIPNIL